MAAQWPRWERLLTQAEQTAAAHEAGRQAVGATRQAADQAGQRASDAMAALTESANTLAQLETARQAAMAALEGFDAAAIATERQALDQRRERLTLAERVWTELHEARAARHTLARDVDHADTARAGAQQLLDEARRVGPAWEAVAAQAERSLAAAELACAASVEQLRATLAEDAPCPVCGATEHPYTHQDTHLHAMLAGLRGEVERARADLRANQSQQAAQEAALRSACERLAGLAQQREALEARIVALTASWDGAPLEAQSADWFAAQRESMRADIDALALREAAWRKASGARDAAQREVDQAQANRTRLQQAADAEREAHARLQAELQQHTLRLEANSTQLDALLAELDAVLSGACSDGWQAQWQRDPAIWRQTRAAEAAQWREQTELHVRATAARATMELELSALTERIAHIDKSGAAHAAEHARLETELARMRTERAALWQGRPTREIERELGLALSSAREQLAARQLAASEAAQAETRARTALAQLSERIAELDGAGSTAATALADWLEDYRRNADDLDPVADSAELAQLLAVGATWLAQERGALGALDAQVASCEAVLAERRAQRAIL
jgi:exonuclease SbcC